ncbi:MAG TPA: glycosyltransferase [Gemmatimonadaceae bacterium]|nr:glycosyltransferase [Gemmatimonadaceae bacterium]
MPRRVLVITPGLPAPPRFGGPIAWYQTLRALRHEGVPVTLVSAYARGADLEGFQRAAAEICDAAFTYPAKQRLTRALHPLRPYYAWTLTPNARETTELRRFCAEYAADADVALLEHPYVHDVYAALAPALPRRHALVLHSLNRESDYYRALMGDLPWTAPRRYLAAAEWLRMGRYERRVVAAADGVASVSDVETAALGATGKAYWFPLSFMDGLPPLELDAAEAREFGALRERADGRPVLLFSGSFLGGHNVRAVHWFLDAVLPRLRARGVRAFTVIAGLRANQFLPGVGGRDVHVVSDFDSPRPLIRLADVHLILTFGTAGVKLKLLEAVYHQKPVVSTVAGVVGSGLGHLVPQSDDPDAFAAACVDALAGRVDLSPLWARYAELYDPARNARAFAEWLTHRTPR